MARQRHVFPTSEIPHLWAAQNPSQTDARNPQGNLFFEGAAIYSYRRSWILGQFHGPDFALVNSERYSVTTARHQNDVCRAVSHIATIAVRDCNPQSAHDHEMNVRHLILEAQRLLRRAEKARTEWPVTHGAERSAELYRDVAYYIAHFRLDMAVPEYPAAAWSAALSRIRRFTTPDPVRDAKLIKAREAAQRRRAAALRAGYEDYCAKVKAYNAEFSAQAAALGTDPDTEWRAGRHFVFKPALDYPWAHWSLRSKWLAAGFELPRVFDVQHGYSRTLLRLSTDGKEIETSLGARIPADHAPRLWALVKACRNAGREYVRNGHTEHAGVYKVDRITADGTMEAGCHTIEFAEMEILARTMGLE